jgi:hypothetical protein
MMTMTLADALQVVEDKYAARPAELDAEFRNIIQHVLRERASKNRMDNSAAAMTKDALNGWLNRKADHFFRGYSETLPLVELTADLEIEKTLQAHFLGCMDRYYSEACHQVDYVCHLVRATVAVHLQADYESLKRNHLANIKMLAAKTRKDAMKDQPQSITYNFAGANARVNINSQDYSINIANSKVIFDKVREVAEQIAEPETKKRVLESVDDMESAVGKPQDYLPRYTKFISLIANHASLFSSLLPALTQFLQ